MNNFFSAMLASLRAKFSMAVARIRLYTSPTYLKSRVLTKLRLAFSKLFDVKPRNRKDYYVIFNWMVSKRLAFALVVVLGLVCGNYIYSMLPASLLKTDSSAIKSYKYNALPLKFYSGECSILDRAGRLAYTGNVEKAVCTGNGTLFDKNGSRVYNGSFDNNMFNGSGTSYYPDGTVKHSGSYLNNLYEGEGVGYYSNGVMSYKGEYSMGMKNGKGTLYNRSGTNVFTGNFLKDSIVFEEFIGKSTEDISQMYTGKPDIYSGQGEHSVLMKDINALYSAKDGSASLDNKWTVDRVIVLSDSFKTAEGKFTSIQRLTDHFGKPDYLGTAKIDLSEAVAINSLGSGSSAALDKVKMKLTDEFDEVHTVNSYDDDFEMYIYSYRHDDLIYTFYCTGSGVDEFVMYGIETA